jgi:beta-N-acetylhexosaminidase
VTSVSRRRFLLLATAGLGAAGVACEAQPESSGISIATVGRLESEAETSLAAVTATATPEPVSLDFKIGQMLLCGFRGPTMAVDDPVGRELSEGRLGNIVLFEKNPAGPSLGNVYSPGQVAELSGQIKGLARMRPLVALDQEGGLVARLNPSRGFPSSRPAQELGASNDPGLTHRHAVAIAAVLKSAGVNLNLAPVVDLNINRRNPVIGGLGRSFSHDPEVVTKHALAFIQAHHESGILCTLKHFPGHGSSAEDSHLGFVDVSETWSDQELVPYRSIVLAGQADAIMTAHVFNRNLDAEFPATLSHKTVTGLLRHQLGYDGVVISDDMQMGAISQRYGLQAALELAINAGVDIIAIANNTVYSAGIEARAFEVIKRAVVAGRISEQVIDEAYRRITRLKLKLTS